MKTVFSIILSIVAFFLAFVAIAVAAPSHDVNFDYLGVVVGVLSFIVTLLIGYQIYTLINVKEELKEVLKAKNEMDKKLQDKANILTDEYKEELKQVTPLILALASSKQEIIETAVFKSYKESKPHQLSKELARQSIILILNGFASNKEEAARKQSIEKLAQNIQHDEVVEFYTDYVKMDSKDKDKNLESYLLELLKELSDK